MSEQVSIFFQPPGQHAPQDSAQTEGLSEAFLAGPIEDKEAERDVADRHADGNRHDALLAAVPGALFPRDDVAIGAARDDVRSLPRRPRRLALGRMLVEIAPGPAGMVMPRDAIAMPIREGRASNSTLSCCGIGRRNRRWTSARPLA